MEAAGWGAVEGEERREKSERAQLLRDLRHRGRNNNIARPRSSGSTIIPKRYYMQEEN